MSLKKYQEIYKYSDILIIIPIGSKVMKRRIISISISIMFITISLANAVANYNTDIIKKVRVLKKELPSGFIFGKVPNFAKSVLKDNPWLMDRAAIKKLTKRIYPGGNYNKILKIHMTIMTNKKNPYGDDIVCYVILYKDKSSANEEIKKISSFAGYNRDRVILLTKNNVAIYLHVDNIENFHYIRDIASNMKVKLANP